MKNTGIRKATQADLPVIRKLLAELIHAVHDTEGIDTGTAITTCEYLLSDAGSHFLVAAVDGIPVAFINFTVRQTILHRSPSAVIDELVVAKEYQGKGVGRQLVLAAIEECEQLGCCEVEVSTEKTNDKARRFYKRCGFQEKGLLFEVDL
jgi:ribosomal protein S18 acetylase RimI-like enzyme